MCTTDNNKQFAVNWNNHMNHIKKSFDTLLYNNDFTDVTLYAEGKPLKAHKMLLSACSQYFQRIFREVPQQHAIVILNGVTFDVLNDILKFIYCGEVSVDCETFHNFLQTAELLQISGLTENSSNTKNHNEQDDEQASESNEETPLHKRPLETENCTEKNVKKVKIESEEFDSFECSPPDEDPSNSSEMPDYDPSNSSEMSDYDPKIMNILKQEYVRTEFVAEQQLFVCMKCGKSYRVKDSLYKHLSVHAGNTTCTVCAKVLSRKTHLERHMLMKHGIALKSGSGG